MEFIINFIGDMMEYAMSFNLNPIIFLVIYFGSGIFIIPSIYFLVRIARKKIDKKFTIPSILMLLFGWFLPYVFVVFWGQGINIWIKIFVIIFAIITLIIEYLRKIKPKLAKPEPDKVQDSNL